MAMGQISGNKRCPGFNSPEKCQRDIRCVTPDYIPGIKRCPGRPRLDFAFFPSSSQFFNLCIDTNSKLCCLAMSVDDLPYLLRIPAEIRMQIYGYLLNNGGPDTFTIKNKPRRRSNADSTHLKKFRRSKYHVLERSMMRRSYETTYHLASEHDIHAAILAVNRKIREEASHYLYGKNSFHFGHELEAVVPFFADKTPSTRDLVKNITLHKRGPCSMTETDSYEWTGICRFLKMQPKLERLRLVVEGGQPRMGWEGPQELSISDMRLLYATRHECLEWARDLAEVEVIGDIEIVAYMNTIPQPKSNAMFIYAAFSASIETSLVEFLRTDLNLPVRVVESTCCTAI